MSKIEWTDRTWNPITGCSQISTGCANCYAHRMARRLRGRFGYREDFALTWHEDKAYDPTHWRKPSKIFTCSMGDLFHSDIPYDWWLRVWSTMAVADRHTYQCLTKRPDVARDRISDWINHMRSVTHGPLENVWIGVTAENQEWADKRIPVLLDIPSHLWFSSLEPLLGPVDLVKTLSKHAFERPFPAPGDLIRSPGGARRMASKQQWLLDWVIVGCETGPKRRPCDTQWVADIVQQCCEAAVPVFVKAIDIDGTVVKDADRIALELSDYLDRHVSAESIREFPETTKQEKP